MSDKETTPRRYSPAVRLVGTALVGICALVGVAGFWLTEVMPQPVLLERYSGGWLFLALVASGGLLLLCGALIRVVWSRTPAPGQLGLGKKLLFAALVMVPAMVLGELALRRVVQPAFEQDHSGLKLFVDGYHALLQIAERKRVRGDLVRTFRGRTHARRKSTAYRVICLGESTTYGHGVEAGEDWPTKLQQVLRQQGHDVEVINAGYPWYTSAHSVVNYATNMRYFDADLVVVMHGVNDLYHSFPRVGDGPMEWDYGSYSGPMANMVRLRDAPPKRSPSVLVRLLRESGFYRAVVALSSRRSWYYSALVQGGLLDEVAGFGGLDKGPQVNPLPEQDLTAAGFSALRPFRSHMDYLVRLIQQDKRQVVLATMASIYTGSGAVPRPPPPEMRYNFFVTESGAVVSPLGLRAGMSAVRQAVVKLARQRGAALADAERAVNQQPALFRDDFHLSVKGNEVVARRVAEVVGPLLKR